MKKLSDAKRKRIMVRLGQWKTPLWRKPSLWLTLVLNLIPILGVLIWEWRPIEALFIYWFEAAVLSVYTIPRFWKLWRTQVTPQKYSISFIPLSSLYIALVFAGATFASVEIFTVSSGVVSSGSNNDQSVFLISPHLELFTRLGQPSLMTLLICFCFWANSSVKLYKDLTRGKLAKKYQNSYANYLFVIFLIPFVISICFLILAGLTSMFLEFTLAFSLTVTAVILLRIYLELSLEDAVSPWNVADEDGLLRR